MKSRRNQAKRGTQQFVMVMVRLMNEWSRFLGLGIYHILVGKLFIGMFISVAPSMLTALTRDYAVLFNIIQRRWQLPFG